MYKRVLEAATYHPSSEVKHAVELALWDQLQGDQFCRRSVRIPATRKEFGRQIHYVCSGQLNNARDAIEIEVTLHLLGFHGMEIMVYRKRIWMHLNGRLLPPEGSSRPSPVLPDWES